MRFPNTSHYPRGSTSLAEAYISFIANEDRGITETVKGLRKGSLRRASLHIGRACLVAEERWEVAQRAFHGIHEELKTSSSSTEKKRWDRECLSLTALMMAHKDRPSAFNGTRRQFHDVTTTALQRSKAASNTIQGERRKEVLGELAEIRTTLLLNRYNHPWAMAVPALGHHDSNKKVDLTKMSDNYDTLYIENGPYTKEPLFHRLQVKSSCFGICERTDGDAQKRWQAFQRMREDYSPGVLLVSGCCDFRLGERVSNLRTDHLLLAERSNQISTSGLEDLDAITNHFSLVASGADPERFGTYNEASRAVYTTET